MAATALTMLCQGILATSPVQFTYTYTPVLWGESEHVMRYFKQLQLASLPVLVHCGTQEFRNFFHTLTDGKTLKTLITCSQGDCCSIQINQARKCTERAELTVAQVAVPHLTSTAVLVGAVHCLISNRTAPEAQIHNIRVARKTLHQDLDKLMIDLDSLEAELTIEHTVS